MIVGTAHGRRNPQFLGVHACLLSIKRAAFSEIITEWLILAPLAERLLSLCEQSCRIQIRKAGSELDGLKPSSLNTPHLGLEIEPTTIARHDPGSGERVAIKRARKLGRFVNRVRGSGARRTDKPRRLRSVDAYAVNGACGDAARRLQNLRGDGE
jgi:hypothetical protein